MQADPIPESLFIQSNIPSGRPEEVTNASREWAEKMSNRAKETGAEKKARSAAAKADANGQKNTDAEAKNWQHLKLKKRKLQQLKQRK